MPVNPTNLEKPSLFIEKRNVENTSKEKRNNVGKPINNDFMSISILVAQCYDQFVIA